MTVRQYIKKEVKVMQRDCAKKGITPMEWVAKNGKSYHDKYAHKVTQHNSISGCFEGYN